MRLGTESEASRSLNTEYHIEYHGPYLQGSGFPAVNGKASLSVPDTGVPLKLQRLAVCGNSVCSFRVVKTLDTM